MKKVLVVVCIVLAAIVVFFVGGKFAGEDLDGLGGEPWIMVGMEIDGKKAPVAQIRGKKLQFTPGVVVWTIPTPEGLAEADGVFKIDASKNPKHIDLEMPGAGNLAPGIYEVKEGTLRICLADNRPTEFTSQNQLLFTFKRK